MARSPSRRTSKFALSPEEREARMKEASDRMETAVQQLVSSDQFRAALKVSSLFPEYSFGNTLLIWSQKPDATRICGFETWKKLGRHVKKGEKAIKIYVPMLVRARGEVSDAAAAAGGDGEASGPDKKLVFRLGNVFDISSTEGADLPEFPHPKILDGDSPLIRAAIAGLCDYNAARGVPVSFTELEGAGNDCNGYWHPSERRIEVRQTLPPLQRLKTLAHETAHAKLHLTHSTSDAERRVRELEAESTAYLVLNSLGVEGADDYTFPYLAYYSSTPESILGVAERARKEAAVITDAIYHTINQQLGTEFVRGVPLESLEVRAEEVRASKAARAEGVRPADRVRDVETAPKPSGVFIAIEGVDGAGKSSLIAPLAEQLRRATGRDVLTVREPGGTATGEEIRTALKAGVGASDPRQQLAMFCTARKALIDEVVRPALEAGQIVVADRHSLSTYVYQGGAGLSEREIADANAAAVGTTRPDATVVLWAGRDELARRRKERNGAADAFDATTDEGLQLALERQARYVALANRTPGALTVSVQGTPQATAAAVVDRLAHVLGTAKDIGQEAENEAAAEETSEVAPTVGAAGV